KPLSGAPAAKRSQKAHTPEETRRQPGFKLPIAGGQKRGKQDDKPAQPQSPEPVSRSRRKA
ncbi:MAG: hypothetical protein M3Y41_05780, partial [Pseudomonadota bacterium]|nr:hypothetical protein [Pseudomonadota bacterium]